MINKKEPTFITKTKVSENQRLSFLPKYLGRSFVRFESIVYQYMSNFCSTYNGGYWEFYELSNGGFYLAPTSESSFHLFVSGNGFDGDLSNDATGIVVTTFALNQVIWEAESETLIEKYHLLLDFADKHKESGLIFSAID